MNKGFTTSNLPAMHGKVAVVTGANTGLGYQTAMELATAGARVYVACRSEQKAFAAIDSMRKDRGALDLEHLPLDLGSLGSVKNCAKQLDSEKVIDLLVNNAGIMYPPYSLTEDGFESQFGVNHIGHYALTNLLLPSLNAASDPRVVTLSSLMARSGEIDFDDINAERGYNPQSRYAMSKLANLLFSYHLDGLARTAGSNIKSIACHPGVADTELSRYMPGFMKLLLPLIKPFVNTAESGAWPTLCAAADSGLSGSCYVGPSKRWQTSGPAVEVPSYAKSQDADLASRLWAYSEQATGIAFPL